MHSLAQAYGQRPSTIAGVSDDWEAYQFDLACLMVGRWIENKLSERDKKGRPRHTLASLLADGRDAGFRSPRHLIKRRISVPESGVW